jgi:hypothetical protein
MIRGVHLILRYLSCCRNSNFDRRFPSKVRSMEEDCCVIVCISCARTIGCMLLPSFARGDDRSLHASFVTSNRRLLDQPCLGTLCVRTRM